MGKKKVVSENISPLFIQKTKLSAPGRDGVSMANAVSADRRSEAAFTRGLVLGLRLGLGLGLGVGLGIALGNRPEQVPQSYTTLSTEGQG